MNKISVFIVALLIISILSIYPTLPFSAFAKKPQKPPPPPPPISKKICVLFFDDGFQNSYTVALPILLKYNFGATFGIITSLIGMDQNTLWARLTSTQIRDLSNKGFEIASHSVTHTDLLLLDHTQRMYELTESNKVLQALITNVLDFIAPYSHTNSVIDAEILSVYQAYRSWDNYPNTIFVGSETLNTFKKEVSAKGNMVFLGYHQLRDAVGDYITSPTLFTQEMKWLYSQKYQVISFLKYRGK